MNLSISSWRCSARDHSNASALKVHGGAWKQDRIFSSEMHTRIAVHSQPFIPHESDGSPVDL